MKLNNTPKNRFSFQTAKWVTHTKKKNRKEKEYSAVVLRGLNCKILPLVGSEPGVEQKLCLVLFTGQCKN